MSGWWQSGEHGCIGNECSATTWVRFKVSVANPVGTGHIPVCGRILEHANK